MPRWDADASRLGQEARVFADEVFASRVVLVVAHFDDRLAGQLGDLCRVEFNRAGASHRRHHRVEDAFDDEDFLFGDAQQVVVVRTPLDDALGGVVQIGRLVDDHRRVARAGNDRSFAAVQRRSSHRGSARHADQRNVAMLEQRFGRFQRRFGNHANQVVDADFTRDRFVESANTFGGDFLARWMRIDDDGVPAGQHADRVAGDRRQAVRDRRDRADDSEGSSFNDRQTMVAAEAFGFQKFDAGREFRQAYAVSRSCVRAGRSSSRPSPSNRVLRTGRSRFGE